MKLFRALRGAEAHVTEEVARIYEYYGVDNDLDLEMAVLRERNEALVRKIKQEMGTDWVAHPQSTFVPKRQPVLAGSRLV